jgi:hypothetical protein
VSPLNPLSLSPWPVLLGAARSVPHHVEELRGLLRAADLGINPIVTLEKQLLNMIENLV